MAPNLYPPRSNSFQPPMMDPDYEPGFQPPRSILPTPYNNMNPMPRMQPQAPLYNPRFGSYPSRRPPTRIHRRHSRRCRPVVHIIESDSCSSISSCSTISSCSRRHHRSCCDSRQQGTSQQQPVILLPIQCQQQPSAMTNSIQGQPSLALPSTSYTTSTSMIQPSFSMPQTVPVGRPQQFRAGPITYIQAKSQLQPISTQSRSTIAPQRVLVNSTNKQQFNLPQTDLKFGRRPFDWYPNDGRSCIITDDIQIGRRGGTYVG